MSALEQSIRAFEQLQAEGKQQRIEMARKMREKMRYAPEHLQVLQQAGVEVTHAS